MSLTSINESCNSCVKHAEKKLAEYVGVKYAKFTSLGRTALVISLKALNVHSGSEVILPSFTCRTVIEAIKYCNAKPVFVDVDPITFNIDPHQIKKSITPKTKAIVVIHCYGLPADINEIQEVANAHDIPIIEDAAHALGAEYKNRKVGSFGNVSVFSFSKNMGASSGGAVVTNSDELADEIEEIFSIITTSKDLGQNKLPIKHKLVGFGRKYKSFFLPLLSSLKLLKPLTKITAATTEEIPSFFGIDSKIAAEIAEKLEKIDIKNSRRIIKARILTQMLESLDSDILRLPPKMNDRKHVFYLYPVKVIDKHGFSHILRKLRRYVYLRSPWKCPYGSEARKLSEQLILLDMRPTLLNEENPAL